MDDLYREFWAAWKRADRYYQDVRDHGCYRDEARRMNSAVRRLAAKIREAERARVGMPQSTVPDVAGQMLMTDIGVHMMPTKAWVA